MVRRQQKPEAGGDDKLIINLILNCVPEAGLQIMAQLQVYITLRHRWRKQGGTRGMCPPPSKAMLINTVILTICRIQCLNFVNKYVFFS